MKLEPYCSLCKKGYFAMNTVEFIGELIIVVGIISTLALVTVALTLWVERIKNVSRNK